MKCYKEGAGNVVTMKKRIRGLYKEDVDGNYFRGQGTNGRPEKMAGWTEIRADSTATVEELKSICSGLKKMVSLSCVTVRSPGHDFVKEII